MDNGFEVKVTEINRKEYLSALRWLQLKRERNMVLGIAIVFALLYGLADPRPIWLLLVGIGLILFIVVYFEVSRWLDYFKFPKEFSMSYEMNSRGWWIQAGKDRSVCAWISTVKLVDTKTVFLLYNTPSSSNLLPKRCLTQEQIEQIRSWYKNRFNLPEVPPEEPFEEEDV